MMSCMNSKLHQRSNPSFDQGEYSQNILRKTYEKIEPQKCKVITKLQLLLRHGAQTHCNKFARMIL